MHLTENNISFQCIQNLSHAKEKLFNPIALRKAKIVYNFGLSECNRLK